MPLQVVQPAPGPWHRPPDAGDNGPRIWLLTGLLCRGCPSARVRPSGPKKNAEIAGRDATIERLAMTVLAQHLELGHLSDAEFNVIQMGRNRRHAEKP
jgi:hypothetical protein